MPFADVVEVCVAVAGAIKKTKRVTRSLHQVDDEPGERSRPTLKGQLACDEVRGGELLAEDLATDLSGARSPERVAQGR
jgi:hypothetical protein